MATKKITPAHPDTKTTAKADDEAASRTSNRKASGVRTGHRKTGRKTSGLKPPG